MTSPRPLSLAGALLAALALGGCSFSGSAQAGVTPATSAPTPVTTAPSTPSTTTPPTTAPPTTSPPGGTTAGSTPSGPTSSAPTPSGPATPTGQTSASPQPGTPAGTTGSDDSDPSRCATRDLAVSIGSVNSAAVGSAYTAVVLENTGAASCTLDGFPGVSYVAGDDGHQVGAPASREGAGAARVTLQPGGVAHAALQVVQHQGYPTATCQPVPVDGYRVYPPGSQAAAFVRESGTTCSALEPTVLFVRPVQPGPPTVP